MSTIDRSNEIKAALTSLIDYILEHRAAVAVKRKEMASKGFRTTFTALSFNEVMDLAARPMKEQRLDELLRDPIDEAICTAIEELGEALHMAGGTALMQVVAERIAEANSSSYGRRIDIMDKRWNGIGARTGDAWWS